MSVVLLQPKKRKTAAGVGGTAKRSKAFAEDAVSEVRISAAALHYSCFLSATQLLVHLHAV
jgi:hypothetical protein